MPERVFFSRMVLPIAEILKNKIEHHESGSSEDGLKYLIFNTHDLHIANFLRFLGYWDKYGYSKHVDFASSVRIEVLQQRYETSEEKVATKHVLRFIYDNEEITFDFCNDFHCTPQEFLDFIESQELIKDPQIIEEYCK